MSLLDLIKGYKIISIIGLAKNTGKTTTLNHLIKEAMDEGLTIGITSIGRDGEPIDLVTETEKPSIYVNNGMLVATATGLLELGTARIAVLRATDYRTALGNVVIGRVMAPGTIQIGGPQSLGGMKEVSDTMLLMGAKLVLLDGAIDRRSSASPFISQAVILSTGAALSKNMNKVIDETKHAINIMKLPKIEKSRASEIITILINENKIAIIDDDLNVNEIELETALGEGRIIGLHIKEDSKYLVIPGSLVANTIDEIISTNKHKNIEIVVRDSTKVFVTPKEYDRHTKQGVRIKVLEGINLIAITLNPTSPRGHNFEPSHFLETMKSHIDSIPIMDLRNTTASCRGNIGS